jgi:hypothetical protein
MSLYVINTCGFKQLKRRNALGERICVPVLTVPLIYLLHDRLVFVMPRIKYILIMISNERIRKDRW